MSEAAANVAARGQNGVRRRGTVELVEAEDQQLVEAIKGLAERLRWEGQLGLQRGETREQVALREAAATALRNARSDVMKLRVLRVVEGRWPGLLAIPGPGGGSRSGSGSRVSRGPRRVDLRN